LKHDHTASLHPTNATQLLDRDPIYLRDLRGATDWSDRQLQIAALFGLLMYPAPDMVLFVCGILSERGKLEGSTVAAYAQTLRQKGEKPRK
jgi:hypothetical protein